MYLTIAGASSIRTASLPPATGRTRWFRRDTDCDWHGRCGNGIGDAGNSSGAASLHATVTSAVYLKSPQKSRVPRPAGSPLWIVYGPQFGNFRCVDVSRATERSSSIFRSSYFCSLSSAVRSASVFCASCCVISSICFRSMYNSLLSTAATIATSRLRDALARLYASAEQGVPQQSFCLLSTTRRLPWVHLNAHCVEPGFLFKSTLRCWTSSREASNCASNSRTRSDTAWPLASDSASFCLMTSSNLACRCDSSFSFSSSSLSRRSSSWLDSSTSSWSRGSLVF